MTNRARAHAACLPVLARRAFAARQSNDPSTRDERHAGARRIPVITNRARAHAACLPVLASRAFAARQSNDPSTRDERHAHDTLTFGDKQNNYYRIEADIITGGNSRILDTVGAIHPARATTNEPNEFHNGYGFTKKRKLSSLNKRKYWRLYT
jgi:hypothetical protein